MFSARWKLILGTTLLLAIVLSISLIQYTSGANSQTPTDVTSKPCPAANPTQGTGTPSGTPGESSTPPACIFADQKSGLGTPVAVAGLTVNLHANADLAGPIDLTIDVTDSNGGPVEGATVIVTTRSMEMDMGEYPHRADEIGPGQYAADQVGMGMGGDWQVEVAVKISGQPTAVAYFLVTLEGLK